MSWLRATISCSMISTMSTRQRWRWSFDECERLLHIAALAVKPGDSESIEADMPELEQVKAVCAGIVIVREGDTVENGACVCWQFSTAVLTIILSHGPSTTLTVQSLL